MCNGIVFSQENNDVVGKIQVLKIDNFINLNGEVFNDGNLFVDELSYTIIALKKNVNGNYSNNKQSGEFSLKPEEKKELAVIRLSLSKGEELSAYLFIKQQGKLISRDTFYVSKKERKKKIEKIDESTFVLKGLVIDEVITKVGKDFYDLFYQSYLLSGIKYPFIIKIKEKPGLTRTTNVSIEVEDNLIFKFRTRPSEEYLKELVKLTLTRLRVYSKQKQVLNNYEK